MKKILLPLLVLSFLSSVASAVDLSGQSRTYLQSLETSDTRLIPLYEYLDFKAEDIGTKSVSFHFGGWYRYDLQNESYGTKSTGDLQYAYLRVRADSANAYLDLGRIIVNQGVIFSQVDGASAGTDLRWGFKVNAFGGMPVETGFDSRTGDSVYGGRVSQGVDGIYQIGVSYLQEKNDSEDFRKEEGADLWFRPFSKVEIAGTTLYNALMRSSARSTGLLTLGPFSFLTLRTDFSQVSYKDYFQNATTSAFFFLPGGLDPNEKVTSVGEEALLTLGRWAVSADYKKLSYKIAGDAASYGGRITFNVLKNAGAGISMHRMDGETRALRYDEYRLYGYDRFGALDFALDLLSTRYDEEINGVKNAYSASLSGGYAITPKARVAADVEYGKNPFYDYEVRGIVKFVYNFDYAPAPGRK